MNEQEIAKAVKEFRLNVDDASVTVRETEDGFWRWSIWLFLPPYFNRVLGDTDKKATEHEAKEEALLRYKEYLNKYKWGKKKKRINWIEVKNERA